jgi:hypothetical protein
LPGPNACEVIVSALPHLCAHPRRWTQTDRRGNRLSPTNYKISHKTSVTFASLFPFTQLVQFSPTFNLLPIMAAPTPSEASSALEHVPTYTLYKSLGDINPRGTVGTDPFGSILQPHSCANVPNTATGPCLNYAEIKCSGCHLVQVCALCMGRAQNARSNVML